MKTAARFAVGCGAGYANDRLAPAVELAASGRVSALCFDALAERTLAQAQVRKNADPGAGHDPRLAQTVRAIAPYVRGGVTVVGSFGAANVRRATELTVAGFRELGIRGVRVASIEGDDVLDRLAKLDPVIPALGLRVSELGERVVSANAYLGSGPVVEALREGAQWTIGGRLADTALYVGPICHALGWDLDDAERVAHATLAAHLLECSTQVTGGYFADPPLRTVPGLANLGYPLAEVDEEAVFVTKLPETGGIVDRRTVAAQLAYEIHDPRAYITPDVVADFADVTCEEVGPDRVRVTGARGRPAPDEAKVLVGVDMGWKAVAGISYAASGCIERAELARELVDTWLSGLGDDLDEVRYDLEGYGALVGGRFAAPVPAEVRLRVAARCATREAADAVLRRVERLGVHGPAGGGGSSAGTVTRALGVHAASIPRSALEPTVEIVET